MATTNYAFEKRRRELEKKAKKEAKRKHKLEAASARASEHGDVDSLTRTHHPTEHPARPTGDLVSLTKSNQGRRLPLAGWRLPIS